MENASQRSVEIIRYVIAEEQRTAFEQAYTQAAVHLQPSPYCLSYQLLHGTDEAANYMVVLEWTSVEEHLNGFRKSPEFGPFFSLVKPFFTSIQEMKHYHRLPGDWTKPALV